MIKMILSESQISDTSSEGLATLGPQLPIDVSLRKRNTRMFLCKAERIKPMTLRKRHCGNGIHGCFHAKQSG